MELPAETERYSDLVATYIGICDAITFGKVPPCPDLLQKVHLNLRSELEHKRSEWQAIRTITVQDKVTRENVLCVLNFFLSILSDEFHCNDLPYSADKLSRSVSECLERSSFLISSRISIDAQLHSNSTSTDFNTKLAVYELFPYEITQAVQQPECNAKKIIEVDRKLFIGSKPHNAITNLRNAGFEEREIALILTSKMTIKKTETGRLLKDNGNVNDRKTYWNYADKLLKEAESINIVVI